MVGGSVGRWVGVGVGGGGGGVCVCVCVGWGGACVRACVCGRGGEGRGGEGRGGGVGLARMRALTSRLSQIMEKIVERRLTPQVRVQRIDELVEFECVPQDLFSERICEQIVNVPVLQADAEDVVQRPARIMGRRVDDP